MRSRASSPKEEKQHKEQRHLWIAFFTVSAAFLFTLAMLVTSLNLHEQTISVLEGRDISVITKNFISTSAFDITCFTQPSEEK